MLPSVIGGPGPIDVARASYELDPIVLAAYEIDNFLISDPALQQVVSHTYEAGLRGNFGADAKTGRVAWGLGVFRTSTTNDIINVERAGADVGLFPERGQDPQARRRGQGRLHVDRVSGMPFTANAGVRATF